MSRKPRIVAPVQEMKLTTQKESFNNEREQTDKTGTQYEG